MLDSWGFAAWVDRFDFAHLVIGSTVLIGHWFDGYWFEPIGSTVIGSMAALFQVPFITLILTLK